MTREEDNKRIMPWYLEPFKQVIETLKQEPTTKNDLGVDLIDRAELLKAMDTWDKFGNNPNIGLILLRTPALQERYVPYVKYDDMVKCVKGMPSVTPQEPILDKIRAEIEAKCCITVGRENDGAITLHDVFEIIDNYKAESEKA